MKKQLGLLFILCINHAQAMPFVKVDVDVEYVDADECNLNDPPIVKQINDFYKTNCKLIVGAEEQYCNCLQSSSNDFVTALGTKADAQKYKAEVQHRHRDRLMNVYAQMNYGSRIQEQAFGMRDEDDFENGCLPEKIAEEFKRSLCVENGGCDDQHAGDLAMGVNKPDDINQKWEDYLKNPEAQAQWMNEKKVADSTQALVESCTLEKSQLGLSEEEKRAVKEVHEFYVENPDLATVDNLKLLKSMQGSSYIGCFLTDFLPLQKEYNFKRSALDIFNKPTGLIQKGISRLGASEGKKNLDVQEMKIASALAKNDEKIKAKMDENFSTNLPNACVRYDHFKVMNSSPSKNLIDAWSKLDPSNDDDLSSALDPQKLTMDSPELGYLKSNPVLAKLVVLPETRKQLAKKLKAFARSSKGKTEADRLKDYIGFMQNEVPALLKKNGFVQLYQCDLLARNLAAVYNSSALPPLDLTGSADANGVSSDLLACNVKKENKNKPAYNVEEVLASNKLFLLMSNDKAPEKLGPNDDKDYQNFLNERCKGYDDFRKKHIKNYCNFFLLGSSCPDKFGSLKKSRSRRLLKKYYEKNTGLADFIKVIDESTYKIDMQDLDNVINPKKQDKVLITNYETKIKPITNTASIYQTSNPFSVSSRSSASSNSDNLLEAVAKAQDDYNNGERVSNSSSFVSNSAGPASSTVTDADFPKMAQNDNNPVLSGQVNNSQPQVNQGQVIPSFLTPPMSSPVSAESASKVSSMEDVKELIKTFDDLDPEVKEQALNNAQDYLEQHENQLGSAELRPKIANLQNKIEDQDENKLSKKAKLANRSIASVGRNTNFNSSSLSSASFASSNSSGLNSSSAQRSSGKINHIKDGQSASYRNALIKIHDKDYGIENPKTPMPVTNETVFQVKADPIQKSDIQGGLVIGAQLNPTSEKFSQILSNPQVLEEYLSQNLKEVPQSKVISIKCKKNCAANANELLLYIDMDSNNKYFIRTISRDTAVIRHSTLKSLKINLQQ